MNCIKNLSVIIPVGPEEEAWKTLLADLCALSEDTEIIFVATTDRPGDLQSVLTAAGFTRGVKWLKSSKGRAKQLNAGATASQHSSLWFLHADGPALTRINTAGAWLRSHVLGLPFGDQGFCVSRDIFQKLGGFDERASYGEDHLFIWKARQKGVPIVCTGGWLGTSARKYSRDGWSATEA